MCHAGYGPRTVTILSDRWAGFGKIPHVAIAELPTAVEPIESLSSRIGAQIWVKRDDATSHRYGGNKVRKLEYLLGEALARKADTIVTCGAAGSHHALATAHFAADLGLKVHVVSFPRPWSSHAEEQLRALVLREGQIHATRSSALARPRMQALAARLRLGRRRPFVIPAGGSSVAGVIGHVEAGLELARQFEAGLLPEPDAVFVALGTGGTLAGLAIGLAAAGITTRLVGVRAVPRAIANRARVGRLIQKTVHHLRTLDARFPDVSSTAHAYLEIDGEELGRGYGLPTPAARHATRLAREHAGLELDPTYTSKAFAGLVRHARAECSGQRLLYVHTLSGAVGEPAAHTPLPTPLRALLER